MTIRYTIKNIFSSFSVYLSLIGGAILCDYILHRAGLMSIGRYFGIIGTVLIISSFIYSLKKRKHLSIGSPKLFLRSHEVLGWIGALMVLVHGGIHLNALIPWLAMISMLVVVASGLTGKFLLINAKEQLKENEQNLRSLGKSESEIEQELLSHSLLVGTMQQWRKIHMPLSMIFFGLASLHIIITFLFWRWQ